MEEISACNQINFKVQVRGKHTFALPCHLIISCFIPFNIMFHFLEKWKLTWKISPLQNIIISFLKSTQVEQVAREINVILGSRNDQLHAKFSQAETKRKQ